MTFYMTELEIKISSLKWPECHRYLQVFQSQKATGATVPTWLQELHQTQRCSQASMQARFNHFHFGPGRVHPLPVTVHGRAGCICHPTAADGAPKHLLQPHHPVLTSLLAVAAPCLLEAHTSLLCVGHYHEANILN